MKLTITREDLRQFVLQEANIDIGQTPIDIDIEGYKQMTGHYKWQETTESISKAALNAIYGSDSIDANYENTVLDFATSPEHKRQVPFFGAENIHCCKARYQKMITKLGLTTSVKFSRIDSLPYLVKREGQESMNDILDEGVNK